TPEDPATYLVLPCSDLQAPVTSAIPCTTLFRSLSLFNANTGAVTYTPNTNYNGPDSFTFTVSDGSLLATGLVSIAVTPINDAPVANNQSVTTPEDTSTNLVLTGTDVEAPVSFSILIAPANGALSLFTTIPCTALFRSNTNYNGPDSFTFTVSDSSLLATGTVSIAVTPVNDAPVANNQNVTTPEDTSTNLVLT